MTGSDDRTSKPGDKEEAASKPADREDLADLVETEPPQKSTADWFFARRPAKSVDAARIRIVRRHKTNP